MADSANDGLAPPDCPHIENPVCAAFDAYWAKWLLIIAIFLLSACVHF
jgi:hypothetical protein